MKKQIKQLWSLALLLILICLPQTMRANDLSVDEDVTIYEDVTYDEVYVYDGTLTIKEGVTVTVGEDGFSVSGGTVIIEEGATVTIGEWGSFSVYGGTVIIESGATVTIDRPGGFDITGGKTFNYGTINGNINLNQGNYCFANHGVVNGDVVTIHLWYNTGTVTGNYNQNCIATCDHTDREIVAYNVTATCKHGGGTKSRCNDCGYISYSEPVADHSMPETFTDGIGVCTVCSYEVFEQPNQDSNDNYLLANTGNLYWFRDFVNTSVTEDENTTYPNIYACAKLTANIVVNDGTFGSDGTFTPLGESVVATPRSWTPIGPDYNYIRYKGTFDGDGHTISGLYCNDSNELGFGLFRYCGNEATVKGVGIVNCYFNCGEGYIGAICPENYGTIDGCYSSGTITSTSHSNAGLCWNNYGTISNCYSTCSVSAPDKAGGICVTNWGTLKNSYFVGSLSNATNKGGICYLNIVFNGSAGTVTNCYTTYGTAIFENNAASGAKVYWVETKDAEAFSKGEVAYRLNGSVDASGTWSAGAVDGNQMWYQKLPSTSSGQVVDDGDSYPVLKKASDGSNWVYGGYADCQATKMTYTNTNIALHATQGHSYRGEKIYMVLNSSELTSFYVCDYGCHDVVAVTKLPGLIVGDINKDNHLSAADITLLIDMLNSSKALTAGEKLLADVDKSGTVDKDDVLHLVQVILGKEAVQFVKEETTEEIPVGGSGQSRTKRKTE